MLLGIKKVRVFCFYGTSYSAARKPTAKRGASQQERNEKVFIIYLLQIIFGKECLEPDGEIALKSNL